MVEVLVSRVIFFLIPDPNASEQRTLQQKLVFPSFSACSLAFRVVHEVDCGMSFTTVQVPSAYGLVLGANIVGILVTNAYLGSKVMAARTKFNVPYPNLYATPGYHKEADAFNRVQRGHQNYFEYILLFTLVNLVGGLKYPLVNVAAVFFFNAGAIMYQAGYADTTLDVKDARHKKGGPIKYIGFFASLGTALAVCSSIAF
jgi:glutathione S-transferase